MTTEELNQVIDNRIKELIQSERLKINPYLHYYSSYSDSNPDLSFSITFDKEEIYNYVTDISITE